MKKVLSVILLTLISITIYGQFGQAYNFGYGLGMYSKGQLALCEGDYDGAFEAFSDGVSYHPINYEGVGVCYELGFGVEIDHDEAWDAYVKGANAGAQTCQQHIQRIKQNGFWPRSTRRTFLNNLRIMIQSQGNMYGQGASGYGGSNGSTSSGSSGRTCAGCHGSGKCSGCAGRGEYRGDGYYGTTIYDCPVCKGSGRCGVCYGRGVIR